MVQDEAAFVVRFLALGPKIRKDRGHDGIGDRLESTLGDRMPGMAIVEREKFWQWHRLVVSAQRVLLLIDQQPRSREEGISSVGGDFSFTLSERPKQNRRAQNDHCNRYRREPP